MLTTDFVVRKLETLTRRLEALQQENATLRKNFGILEESIEALTGHGIDLDDQLAEIYGRLRDLEKSRGSKKKAPILTFVQERLNACNTP